MAKVKKKKRKLTTNEALELLLGRKAAKRLRRLAMRLAAEDANGGETGKDKKTREKAKRKRRRRAK
jgi:hypothetical protein